MRKVALLLFSGVKDNRICRNNCTFVPFRWFAPLNTIDFVALLLISSKLSRTFIACVINDYTSKLIPFDARQLLASAVLLLAASQRRHHPNFVVACQDALSNILTAVYNQ